jgi:hypothetical protein
MAYGNFSLMVRNPIGEHRSVVTLSSSLASSVTLCVPIVPFPLHGKQHLGPNEQIKTCVSPLNVFSKSPSPQKDFIF